MKYKIIVNKKKMLKHLINIIKNMLKMKYIQYNMKYKKCKSKLLYL